MHYLPPTKNDEVRSGKSSFGELGIASGSPFVQAQPVLSFILCSCKLFLPKQEEGSLPTAKEGKLLRGSGLGLSLS